MAFGNNGDEAANFAAIVAEEDDHSMPTRARLAGTSRLNRNFVGLFEVNFLD